jgi:CDP-L-myo-inositol myo-inositolphosphotransferase
MALGLFMLGLRTRGTGQQLTFNELKDRFRERPSAVKRWLTWLTMRDFYALAGVAFVVTGFAHVGLVMFAVIATGWLAAVLTLAMRKA